MRRCDPLAAALGNATLLGVGHLLMRRWGAAVGTVLVTAVLVSVLAAVGPPAWPWRVILLLWWVTTIFHGWRLARGPRPARAPSQQPPDQQPPDQPSPDQPPPDQQAPDPAAAMAGGPVEERTGNPRLQRIIATGLAAAMLLAVLGTAIDARRIEQAAADDHRAGECDEAIEITNRINGRHRVVAPFVARRAAEGAEACRLLVEALASAEDTPVAAATTLAQYVDHDSALWEGAHQLRADLLLTAGAADLDAALGGDTDSLESGFNTLAVVLAVAPERSEDVNQVLTGYLDALPAADPCDAVSNIDWLREREPSGNELDQASAQVDEIAPPALRDCGDQLLDRDPEGALDVYEVLLDRYPDHQLADAAREGVNDAETLIEEANVRQLLSSGSGSGDLPRYCADPAPYRGAAPYSGGGPHRALVHGASEFSSALPSEWKADDHTDAVLILCVEGPEYGTNLGSCDYIGGITVSLHAREYEVRAYELHTGELAFDTTVQARGDCPGVITYYEPNIPTQILVSQYEAGIRSAAQPWVFP